MKSTALVVGLMMLLFALPVQAQVLTEAQKAEIEKILTDATKEMNTMVSQLSTDGMAK